MDGAEAPLVSPSEVSPPPSDGPGPLLFDEDQSPEDQDSDEMRGSSPSSPMASDTKMY